MSHFNHFITITIFFLNVKAQIYPILKKYGKERETTGIVIFESKDFSEGDNMYIKIQKSGQCTNDLQYDYFNTSEEIKISSFPKIYISSKSSSSTSENGIITSTTRYFTIKKNSKEYKNSNGNYLLLLINCYNSVNDIDFENIETYGSKKVIITVVIVLVVSLVVIGVIIGVCCYCYRKRAGMKKEIMNPAPMMLNGGSQPMNPQQDNVVYVYDGKEVLAQSNGIPHNNPNIKYSNIPNNTSEIPKQNYDMIPQSSAERGYNSNFINEKLWCEWIHIYKLNNYY